ncbi:MAG: hypothetical protein GF381_02770 [Candidatus Pacebacteria bacterium]|nr:hypothetical protein [Candidatus Paceibacterota bacterium]
MKTIHLTLAGLGLIAGLLILAVSLVSVNQVISYEGTQASCRKFYLGEQVLPDHLLYPVVAGLDRGLLILSPNSKKTKLRVNYGWIRYDYAVSLLKKGNPGLALSSLTKSQKYFYWAAYHLLEEQVPSAQLEYLINNLELHLQAADMLAQEFTDSQRVTITQMNEQNRVLLSQLQEKKAAQ